MNVIESGKVPRRAPELTMKYKQDKYEKRENKQAAKLAELEQKQAAGLASAHELQKLNSTRRKLERTQNNVAQLETIKLQK